MVLWFLITAVIILLDQFTKWLVMNSLNIGDSISVISGIFNITYAQNPGAAFGILAYRTNFFIAITILLAIIIIVLFIILDKEYNLLKLGLALQLGGALGNFIDRVKTGYVIDFFDFSFWPVFNMADIAIVTGVAILIIFIIKEPGENEGKENVY